LNNPQKVAEYIANLPRANSYKANLVKAYNWHVKLNGLSWEKPKYKWEQQKPKIPTNEALKTIIERASKRYSIIFKTLRETGVMPYELSKVSLKDLDFEKNTMNVRGFKGHAVQKTQITFLFLFCVYGL
jgi:integrase